MAFHWWHGPALKSINPLKTEGILQKFQKVIERPNVEGFQK
jgi:hypothetical protein